MISAEPDMTNHRIGHAGHSLAVNCRQDLLRNVMADQNQRLTVTWHPREWLRKAFYRFAEVLIFANQCDTMSHMKTITIRELHEQTGRWIRRASEREVYVTERGRLVAKIVAASPLPAKPFFANPRFTRAFLAQRKYLRGGSDSTQTISEERNHEVL
jgi:antitoxin (DNA-binding transcriptional repressor) of toxin-antitoxin stability system